MTIRKFLYWGAGDEITEASAGDTPPGLNRDHEQRDTLLSTNSTIYVNYLTMMYTAEVDGQFKVDAELIWNTDKANRDVSIELAVDGTPDETTVHRTSNPATQLRLPTTQVHMLDLLAGTYTITINVKVESASQTLDVFHGDVFIERWDI